jgi:hypothetical protein
MLDSPSGELRAVVEPESVEHLRNVIGGCPDGDDQFLCDLAVGATTRDESDDLPLARSEYWRSALLVDTPRSWRALARR